MAKLLDNQAKEKQLKTLDVEWSLVNGTTLSRVYKFDNFSSALVFVNKVGKLAEEANHHPDIALSWGKVVVNITTHDAGGLTNKDYQLAKSLDKL